MMIGQCPLVDTVTQSAPSLGSILSAIRLPLKQGEQIPYYCPMGAAQALKLKLKPLQRFYLDD